jgi:hypothetical protein
MTAEKHRPIGITILAILAFIAGVVNLFHALQFFGISLVWLGGVNFFGSPILSALMYGILALIWFWVGYMLWKVNPQGWLFVVIITILNLCLAGLAIIGQSTFSSQLPAIIINGVILIYALTPGVKRAFGTA